MIFNQTLIPGVWLIACEQLSDIRGFFARTVCAEQFAQHGLNAGFVQQSMAYNRVAGTLRGLHYQTAPYEEEKLVRVTRGAVFDVVVDLRRDSPAFGRWFGVVLTGESHQQLYIPKGVAHGYQTMADDTEVLYQMTQPFHAEASRGLLWNDPSLAITWPDCAERVMSDNDRKSTLFAELIG